MGQKISRSQQSNLGLFSSTESFGIVKITFVGSKNQNRRRNWVIRETNLVAISITKGDTDLITRVLRWGAARAYLHRISTTRCVLLFFFFFMKKLKQLISKKNKNKKVYYADWCTCTWLILKSLAGWGCRTLNLASEGVETKATMSRRKASAFIIFLVSDLRRSQIAIGRRRIWYLWPWRQKGQIRLYILYIYSSTSMCDQSNVGLAFTIVQQLVISLQEAKWATLPAVADSGPIDPTWTKLSAWWSKHCNQTFKELFWVSLSRSCCKCIRLLMPLRPI